MKMGEPTDFSTVPYSAHPAVYDAGLSKPEQ
jgi:hypothetical protein